MEEVSIRELRNHGGDVVDRVALGERVIVTRSGKPVAEMRPMRRDPIGIDLLIARRKLVPQVDPSSLTADIDKTLDSAV